MDRVLVIQGSAPNVSAAHEQIWAKVQERVDQSGVGVGDESKVCLELSSKRAWSHLVMFLHYNMDLDDQLLFSH